MKDVTSHVLLKQFAFIPAKTISANVPRAIGAMVHIVYQMEHFLKQPVQILTNFEECCLHNFVFIHRFEGMLFKRFNLRFGSIVLSFWTQILLSVCSRLFRQWYILLPSAKSGSSYDWYAKGIKFIYRFIKNACRYRLTLLSKELQILQS